MGDHAVFFLFQQHEEHHIPLVTDTQPSNPLWGTDQQCSHRSLHRRAAIFSLLSKRGTSHYPGTWSLPKVGFQASQSTDPKANENFLSIQDLRLTVASSQRLEIHCRLTASLEPLSHTFHPPPRCSIRIYTASFS